MENKKAQAALEFLTTYGWAFLVILIMIAALAYFGILSPGKMMPERCDFGSNFECTGYEIDYGGAAGTTGQFKFQLMNKVGMDIIVDSVSGIITESAATYDCTITDDGLKWADRGFKGFTSTADCNSDDVQFSKGKKGKIKLKLTYYKIGASAFKHEVEAEIYANVR